MHTHRARQLRGQQGRKTTTSEMQTVQKRFSHQREVYKVVQCFSTRLPPGRCSCCMIVSGSTSEPASRLYGTHALQNPAGSSWLHMRARQSVIRDPYPSKSGSGARLGLTSEPASQLYGTHDLKIRVWCSSWAHMTGPIALGNGFRRATSEIVGRWVSF